MARASLRLVTVLRQTARRLAEPATIYRWSDYALCNCGHLAQTVTGLLPAEIRQRAFARQGDWATQALVYRLDRPDYGDRPALDEGAWEPENVGTCPATGLSLDDVLSDLLALGLDQDDIAHLERLDDPRVRRELGQHLVDYPHYVRQNVVDYLEAWARLLERDLGTESAAALEDRALAAE